MRVLRPLLVLLTVIVVLVAIATTTGRVLVALLPRFETQLNALLLERGIELGDMTGAWHRLNPIIRIGSVRFVGGRARDVTIELDLLESALRSGLVMRHFAARLVELSPLQDADGHWRIGNGGARGGSTDSLQTLLRYSDHIDLPDVQVRFVGSDIAGSTEGRLGELRGRVMLVNTGLDHAGQIVVQVVAGGGGEVALRYDIAQGLFGNPSRGRVVLTGDSLSVDAPFGLALGGAGLNFDTLQADWTFAQGASTGALTLAVRDIVTVDGGLGAVDVVARGSMERFGLRWLLAFDELRARGADGSIAMDGASAALDWQLDGGMNLDLTLPEVDLAQFNGVAKAVLGTSSRFGEWFNGLDPRGHLNRAVGRIDLTNGQLSYVANVSALQLENFKGVPYVRNGSATLAGTERALSIDVDASALQLGFFNFYESPFEFDSLSGELLLWFRPGYLAISGTRLSAVIGGTRANGQFAVGRPAEPSEQRVFATARVLDVDASEALTYVPRVLGVRAWLDQAIVAGHVDQADFAYHGHLRTIETLPMRRYELDLQVSDVGVQFHPDWPALESVSGQVRVTTNGIRGAMQRGRMLGLNLGQTSIDVPAALDRLRVRGLGSGNGEALHALIDASPLSTWLSFITPEWRIDGPFNFVADLMIPLTSDAGQPSVDLGFDLDGMDVYIAQADLAIGSLRGPLRYAFPSSLQSDGLDAVLLGHPARLSAVSVDGEVRLEFSGHTTVNSVSEWRGLPVGDLASGELDFSGDYRIMPGRNAAPVLTVNSDLLGTTLNLPAPLGKTAATVLPSAMALTFGADHDQLELQLGNAASGWLRILPGGIQAGRIGIGMSPDSDQGDEDTVTLTGAVADLDLTNWFGGAEAAAPPGFAWSVENFQVGRAYYRSIGFDEVVVDATGRGDTVQISVVSPELAGAVTMVGEAPVRVELNYLKMPALQGKGAGDPLANVDARVIGDLDVSISQVQLGEDDYGQWQFQTRKSATGLAIDNLIADVKGLHIESPSGTSWVDDGNWHTTFNGRLSAANLATVLPQWKYAPTIETTSTVLDADLRWAGSPFNFSLPIVNGRMVLKAENGRFIDAGDGAGAVRIFSLLNFAAIAKRMTLDFSDVFGKGISFDEVSATALADMGTIHLVEPLVIDGTGGNFQINGSVNFITGALDNEMLVTLPVSSSLPWYAAYLGFVNPLAAGAVLVGERIFRNQIEKFSSAKYKVSGTLQDPKVTFVRVFPKAIKGSEPADADSQPVPATDSPAAVDVSPPGNSVGDASENVIMPAPPKPTQNPTEDTDS